ncbi:MULTISPECIES: Ltp family lipoprotein [Arthrobacter]|uniref:Ltp family lipoprotein n=2 Tax=Arthrobacter TaxID=1663 RepID=A0ABU9KM19_9MICC|nr:Ltp family lipoprotein [Arthrobacter sp. YJM1]MDP5228117.1 Ltp family lipoprotein [Arthrobacter sp. YJM1]
MSNPYPPTGQPAQPSYPAPPQGGYPQGQPQPPYGAPQNGAPLYQAPQYGAPPQFTPQYKPQDVGTKSFLVTWLLSLLVGGFGIDRFYLGKVGTGIAKLLTFGGLGIWALVDLILVLTNKQTDKQGLKLEGYEKHKVVAIIVTVAVIVVGGIGNVVNGVNSGSKSAPALDGSDVSVSTPTTAPAVDPAIAAAEASASAKAQAEAAAKAKAQAEADAKAQAKAEAEAAAKRGTPGQQNAKRKAESYLNLTAFSRSGLIGQLEFEKFSAADATWAVDHLEVDWNVQAEKKAKKYLEMTSFSHAGLVDQLTFEGFTPEQAEYGATKAGI